jgi:MSHA biogenesis protein MshP
MRRPFPARRRGGFAYIAAVVFLVVLGGFALAALRLSAGAQATVGGQLLGARSAQAARGGIEWALLQLKGPGGLAACNGSVNGRTLTDFVQASGALVTVTCSVRTYTEGQQPDGTNLAKNIFELTATACNGATACPNNSQLSSPDYVERKRSASLCIASDGSDCY